MPNRRINNRSRRSKVVNNQATKELQQINRHLANTEHCSLPPRPDPIWSFISTRKVHNFVETYTVTVNGSTTIEVDGAFIFSLSNLGNAGAYQALFDQYRIVRVRLEFVPNTTTSSSVIGNAPITTAVDYDDGSNTTRAALLQYDTVMTTMAGQKFERVLTPKAALGAYGGSAFTSFAASMPQQWMDIASPAIQYYALKYAIPTATSVAPSWYVDVNVHLQTKSTR